jgi:hypothetical protein
MEPFTQQVGHLHRSFFRCRSDQDKRMREYPPVDPTRFILSASTFQTLMRDGNRIILRVAESRAYAQQIKEAAQVDDRAEVERLIRMASVSSDVEVHYTPSAIRLELRDTQQEQCCILSMLLRW